MSRMSSQQPSPGEVPAWIRDAEIYGLDEPRLLDMLKQLANKEVHVEVREAADGGTYVPLNLSSCFPRFVALILMDTLVFTSSSFHDVKSFQRYLLSQVRLTRGAT